MGMIVDMKFVLILLYVMLFFVLGFMVVMIF